MWKAKLGDPYVRNTPPKEKFRFQDKCAAQQASAKDPFAP